MHFKKWMYVGVMATVVAGMTGCGLIPHKTSEPVNEPVSQSGTVANGVDKTLYFVDQKGFVVPLVVKVPQTEGIAKEVLEYMVAKGPGDAQLKGTGLHGALPEGTKVKGVSIKDGLARVELSKEGMNLPSSKEESQMVDAIVWALTEFPNIKKVQIQFDGREVPALKGGTPVGMALSRDEGINLQVADRVNPSNSSKITLYFEGSNQEGNFHYLVPVTRVIPKIHDSDAVATTLNELAAGPKVEGLQATVQPTAKLLSPAKVENGVASLNFNEGALSSGAGKPIDKEAIESIVLSVSANAGVGKIRITVNGQVPSVEKGIDLTKPVSKPQFVNQKTL
ncbi:sporulation protein [Collibacillus ludicampi]|jgi:germination protein M|uniref:Sporulation protein n=1 Tax=Collibacillus ludicampi TaxID=2771369 RepID=A0AAV4LA22_9BACL|nr:GerMN domain-containing protein [Collibacillus ludicampi]GIM44650.1 sporulation protein [Collibacillus ludicampi]